MLACGSDPAEDKTSTPLDTAEAPAADPAELGPYSVGTEAFGITGRTGVELLVQVWYPTQRTDGRLYSYLGAYTGLAQDAPAPDCEQSRPLVAFSHGNTGTRWQSTFLTEHLASHGFVVVAPDHTGNTSFDDDTSRKPELIFRRPWDISDSVDHLFSAADGVLPGLSDCMDPEAGFAISGHSFGGYTTMALAGGRYDSAATAEYCEDYDWWLCEDALSRTEPDSELSGTDDRVWAAVPMAPAGYEVLIGGLSEVTAPVMVLGGSKDELTPMEWQVGPIYDGLRSSPRMLGSLTDAGHFLFSNACEILASTNEECTDEYLLAEVGHPEVAATTTAFLRWVLGEQELEEHLPYSPELWDWTRD
jgi:predicted dienelactone hydrolase